MMVGIESAIFILLQNYNNLRVVDTDWLELNQPYLVYYETITISEWWTLIG